MIRSPIAVSPGPREELSVEVLPMMDPRARRDLSRDIEDLVVAYWYDVDFEGATRAADHYTVDAVFGGPGDEPKYHGRAEIAEFYAFRRDRGARTNAHVVSNFRSDVLDDGRVAATWICTLYAHDGAAPQMSAAPINIARVDDTFIYDESSKQWLCQVRAWNTLFRGGVPATSLSGEQIAARLASKPA